MTTAIANYQPTGMLDPTTFEHMQRVGKMLALSPLFPDHLRKPSPDVALANGVLCINMAMRLNEDVLTVAQNIFFVNGRPGWAATYMIAKANQSGKFINPIDWDITGEGEAMSATAWAELSSTGKRVQAVVDMKMARAEGWTKNPKYQSMPRQMLSYRSAVFLIRLYVPEVMVGVPSTAELEDEAASEAKDVTPAEEGIFDKGPVARRKAPAKPPVEEAQTAPELPAAKPAEVEAVEKVVEKVAEKAVEVETVNQATGEVTTAPEAKPAEVKEVAKTIEEQVKSGFDFDDKPQAAAAPAAVAEGPGAAAIQAKFDNLKGQINACTTTDEVNNLWSTSKTRLDAIKAAREDLFGELAELADARAETLMSARG